MIINTPYFVYTSGEKGLNGLDWGVKFASIQWGAVEEVDTRYRTLLEQFGLKPALERPGDGEVGVLLLPFTEPGKQNCLMGIFWPYNDAAIQGKRPNISLLALMITHELKSMVSSPGCLIDAVLQQNGVETIALRTEDRHPAFLERPRNIQIDSAIVESFSKNHLDLNHWPEQSEGFLKIGQQIKKLSSSRPVTPNQIPSRQSSHPPTLRKLLWTGIAIGSILIAIALFNFLDTGPTETNQIVIQKQDKSVAEKSGDQSPKIKTTQPMDKFPAKAVSVSAEIIGLFDNAHIRDYQYVTLLYANQRKSMKEHRPITGLTFYPLGNRNVSQKLDSGFVFHSGNGEDLPVTEDILTCFIDRMVEKLYPDWNSAKEIFRNLRLTSQFDIQSDHILAKAVTDCMPKHGGTMPDNLDTSKLKAKLEQEFDRFLSSSELSNQSSKELKQKIAFISPMISDQAYRISYLDSASNGDMTSKHGIIFKKDSVKIIDSKKFKGTINRLFQIDKDKLIVLVDIAANKKINEILITLVEKAENKKINEIMQKDRSTGNLELSPGQESILKKEIGRYIFVKL